MKFTLLILVFLISGCSLDSSISSLVDPTPPDTLNRKDPDLLYGEVVTTSSGYQFKGVFGEISEKSTGLNNSQWQFEGVFYE